MQDDGKGGFTELGAIAERPSMDTDGDQYAAAAPALGRASLARSSASQPASIGSARRPALARVSAHDFPNLSRASQRGDAARAGASGLNRSSVIKAKQELERRNAALTTVSATIEIKNVTKQKAVTYKNDGSRFSRSQFTLKLVQGHVYEFVVQFADVSSLVQSANLGGTIRDGFETTDVEFKARGPACVAEWTCNSKPSSRGARHPMELSIPVDAFGLCVLPLSVKVYAPGKYRNSTSGMRLRSILLKFNKQGEAVVLKTQQWV